MMKPPKALQAPAGTLHSLLSLSPTTQSSTIDRQRNRCRTSPHQKQQASFKRHTQSNHAPQFRLMHTQSTSQHQHHQHHNWPLPTHPHTTPTPYEIFNQHPKEPYSKRRFYELVKIYHPDTCGYSISSNSQEHVANSPTPSNSQSTNTIPHTLRLHRYRLIIEANAILSDPVKRKAYDTYGAGWAGSPDVEGIRRENSERGWRAYGDAKHSPANCATWEDWDRWWAEQELRRQQQEWENSNFSSLNGSRNSKSWFSSSSSSSSSSSPDATVQKPVYISNGSFVLLIVLFTIAGTVHEMNRAGRMSMSLLEQLETKHNETSKALMKSRQESLDAESNDARVKQFLKLRGEDRFFKPRIEEKEGGLGKEMEEGRVVA
jgi:curved DNA-binding protein CbpA